MLAKHIILIAVLAFLFGCGKTTEPDRVPATTSGSTLSIRTGRTIAPEGKIGAGEWADADSLHIRLDSSHAVTVQFKHDRENLLVRFTGVASASRQVEPEVFLNLNHSPDSTWQPDDLLLHVGYQDCEGHGSPDSLSCGMLQRGWFANNLPVVSPGIVELKVSFERLGLTAASDTVIGLAFGVQLPNRTRVLWPDSAMATVPASWGTAHLLSK